MANKVQLQQTLQKKYNRIIFAKEILSPIFGNNFSLYSHPVNAPDKPNKSESRAIQQVQVYGKIYLDDHTEVSCFEILLQPNVLIERSRVAVQQYVRKMLTAGQAAFINFVSPTYDNLWRLTFVAKDSILTEKGVKEKMTHARRYTYLLGPSETCRTAAERFESLSTEKELNLELLINAFSVERLGKIFFDEYKYVHYSAFIEALVGEKLLKKSSKEDEWIKTGDHSHFFVKAFLEKTTLEEAKANARNFVKKLMGRIVFLYFVQKKGWLGASNTNYADGDPNFMMNLFKKSGGDESFYQNWLVKLFFETLNSKDRNEDFELPDGKIVKIPYLNGGLFDKEEHDNQILVLKTKLFHNAENPDSPKERGFLDFLNSFNFTVFEDSPEEHTVAVDPEMMGHIFENLLEDNKDKGAFYTPKQIVHYMCQESLTEYLATHLAKEYKIYRKIGENQFELFGNESRTGQLSMIEEFGDNALDRCMVENLVKDKNIDGLSPTQLNLINSLLNSVKICDPAIGSGAFPMGLLLEIFAIKETIAFELDLEWKPAEVKESIIQNSIYGVDIEKGAVDIARLRFWLSLLVDEKKPKPLPNLDYKIVVGNSLISKFEDEIIEIDWSQDITSAGIYGQANREKTIELLKAISAKQHSYFHAENSDKRKQSLEIRNLKIDLLINQFEQMVTTKGLDYKPTGNGKKIKEQTELYLQTQGWLKTIKSLESIKKEPNLKFDHFDWKLDFPNVLNPFVAHENCGFDIVIGNPPYGANFTQVEKKYIKINFFSMEGDFDSYIYFLEYTFKLVKREGQFSFIIPNNVLIQKFTKKIREILLKNATLHKIIDLGLGVFKEAVVPTAIICAQNANSNSNKKVYTAFRPETIEKFDLNVYNQEDFLKNVNYSFNIQISRQELNVLNQMKSVNTLLGEICEIKIGIEGAPEFINTTPISPISKPLVRGRNFNRFFIDFENDPKYIEYDHKLLHRAREERLFLANRKILIRQTGDKIIATIDNKQLYAWKSVFVLLANEKEFHLNYLLSILNSKAIVFYYQKIVGEAGRTFAQVKGVNLVLMPIPIIKITEQVYFITLVDYLLFLFNNSTITVFEHTENIRIASHIDDILDMMVSELYFEAHLKENGIDVLQFINPIPIAQLKSDKEKAEVIKDFYLWYQKPENPVRQRILLVETRSPEILAVINKSVQ